MLWLLTSMAPHDTAVAGAEAVALLVGAAVAAAAPFAAAVAADSSQ